MIPSLILSDVFLRSEILDRHLANNSFISTDNIGGVNSAIICGGRPNGAEWLDTEGQVIMEGYSGNAANRLFYTQMRDDGIHLFQGVLEFSTEHEGVYACHIDDGDGNRRVLFIGIYTPESSGESVLSVFIRSIRSK